MSKRLEREYLIVGREEVEWANLEEKLEAETIDIRATMEEKRKWFMDTQGWHANDVTVNKAWERRND